MLPEKEPSAGASRALRGGSFRAKDLAFGPRGGTWYLGRMASTPGPAATQTMRAVSGPALNVALHAQIAREGSARPSTLASALAALKALRQAKAECR